MMQERKGIQKKKTDKRRQRQKMRFAYEIKNGCAVVRRCYDFGKEAEIPSEIEDCPVTELGAYAFSAHLNKERFRQELKTETVKIWNDEMKDREPVEPSPDTAP